MSQELQEFEDVYNHLSPAIKIQVLQAYRDENAEICQDAVGNSLVISLLSFDKKIKEGIMVKEIIEAEVKKEEMQIAEIAKGKTQLLVTRKELSIDEMEKTAKYLIASGYFKDVQSLAQGMAKIQYGQELGFPPYYSLVHLYMTPGKPPGTDGQAMAALIRNRGYDFRGEADNKQAIVTIFGKKGEKLGTANFTIQEADKITFGEQNKPLSSKKVWKDYTQDMLWWRAMSRCARRYAPDAISGVYYYEEVGYDNIINGEIVKTDLSDFKVEISKSVPISNIKPEKTRKDILNELVNKYKRQKLEDLKKEMKINISLLEVDDKTWDEFVLKLTEVEKPVEQKPIKEKEAEKVKDEFSRNEKLGILERYKQDFSVGKIKEIKEVLKLEGKLADLDDKSFKKFMKAIEKEIKK